MEATAEVAAPRRGRPPRQAEIQGERRRRKDATLDMGATLKLDCSAEHLDPNYVYRMVNDVDDRIHALTIRDDYDFVDAADLRGVFSGDATDSDSRIRRRVGTEPNGTPIYSFMLRKPKEFWAEDYNKIVAHREDQLNGIRHATTAPDAQTTSALQLPDGAYIPEGNRVGAVRRKAA